jgi:hypothetical protein
MLYREKYGDIINGVDFKLETLNECATNIGPYKPILCTQEEYDDYAGNYVEDTTINLIPQMKGPLLEPGYYPCICHNCTKAEMDRTAGEVSEDCGRSMHLLPGGKETYKPKHSDSRCGSELSDIPCKRCGETRLPEGQPKPCEICRYNKELKATVPNYHLQYDPNLPVLEGITTVTTIRPDPNDPTKFIHTFVRKDAPVQIVGEYEIRFERNQQKFRKLSSPREGATISFGPFADVSGLGLKDQKHADFFFDCVHAGRYFREDTLDPFDDEIDHCLEARPSNSRYNPKVVYAN